MGIYYYLYNDTKRHEVHLDSHIKNGPMRDNKAVHYAMLNYMMDNQGDSMRIIPDCGSEPQDYQEVDLMKYKFAEEDVIHKIVALLNDVYNKHNTEFEVIDGVGVEVEECVCSQ